MLFNCDVKASEWEFPMTLCAVNCWPLQSRVVVVEPESVVNRVGAEVWRSLPYTQLVMVSVAHFNKHQHDNN